MSIAMMEKPFFVDSALSLSSIAVPKKPKPPSASTTGNSFNRQAANTNTTRPPVNLSKLGGSHHGNAVADARLPQKRLASDTSFANRPLEPGFPATKRMRPEAPLGSIAGFLRGPGRPPQAADPGPRTTAGADSSYIPSSSNRAPAPVVASHIRPAFMNANANRPTPSPSAWMASIPGGPPDPNRLLHGKPTGGSLSTQSRPASSATVPQTTPRSSQQGGTGSATRPPVPSPSGSSSARQNPSPHQGLLQKRPAITNPPNRQSAPVPQNPPKIPPRQTAAQRPPAQRPPAAAAGWSQARPTHSAENTSAMVRSASIGASMRQNLNAMRNIRSQSKAVPDRKVAVSALGMNHAGSNVPPSGSPSSSSASKRTDGLAAAKAALSSGRGKGPPGRKAASQGKAASGGAPQGPSRGKGAPSAAQSPKMVGGMRTVGGVVQPSPPPRPESVAGRGMVSVRGPGGIPMIGRRGGIIPMIGGGGGGRGMMGMSAASRAAAASAAYLDEYTEEDLDFIDDDEETEQAENEAQWRKMLRGVTGYDPGKFAAKEAAEGGEVDIMVSNSRQVQFEEELSAKKAALEDAEELKRILAAEAEHDGEEEEESDTSYEDDD